MAQMGSLHLAQIRLPLPFLSPMPFELIEQRDPGFRDAN
jgi:hypothetical protein